MNLINIYLPLETVPDERNPQAVPCELVNPYSGDNEFSAQILGDWFSSEDDNRGGHTWYFQIKEFGDPETGPSNLALLRNVETARD